MTTRAPSALRQSLLWLSLLLASTQRLLGGPDPWSTGSGRALFSSIVAK